MLTKCCTKQLVLLPQSIAWGHSNDILPIVALVSNTEELVTVVVTTPLEEWSPLAVILCNTVYLRALGQVGSSCLETKNTTSKILSLVHNSYMYDAGTTCIMSIVNIAGKNIFSFNVVIKIISLTSIFSTSDWLDAG